MGLSFSYCPVHKTVHDDERCYDSCDDIIGWFRPQDTSHSSHQNIVEIVYGGGIGGDRSHTRHSPYHNPGDIVRLFGLSVCGDDRGGNRSHTIHIPYHNHGGQYIVHPRFPQDDFSRGVQEEIVQTSHQGCCLYPHQNHHYYPYPSIPPRPICSFPYCTSSLVYAPYGVAHHPHTSSFGYLYRTPLSFITSSVSPDLLTPYFSPFPSNIMTEHRSNSMN